MTTRPTPIAALALFATAVMAADAGTQAPASSLIASLRQGGFVLLMRHASSPREAPTRETAASGNTTLERQLDAAGREGATALGDALRRLQIPIEAVVTSPMYRAVETVTQARLEKYTIAPELGENVQSMLGVTEAQAAWLRERAAQPPRRDNVLLVTHQPNLAGAFPEWGNDVAQGEIVVVRPDGRGGTAVAGRIRIEEWPALTAAP